ncbi:hypothetical protein QQY66_49075 [Streptomyces sp. DG2A-72]|uniref:hypothetical protein n=1 Tax=Streptomyces sp. DG2A-72 TaxID=3051386 RepID=UPI00265C6EBF|nr:hypothetical protein [Streptomyces sp. DG2A-72]MDO0939267.1 hypothetical protein [Streptomyces sp. DG2A-72]
MTHTTAPLNVFRIIAAEQADFADAEAENRHPQLARTHAELGLVYLEFENADSDNPRVTKAWCAAESARMELMEGTATGASVDVVRARLHLALAQLDQAAGTTD